MMINNNSEYRGDTPQIKEEPGYYGNSYYENGYSQPRYGSCQTPYQYQVFSLFLEMSWSVS